MQKKFNYQGAEIIYEDHGEGQPLILLHGFAEDAQIWKNIYPAAPNHRLIIPDLPGSGKSKRIPDISIDSIGEAIVALMKNEKITEAVIIGHSMGGYVTLAIAEKHPEMVTAFGLFHSTAFADTEEKKNTRRKNIGFIKTHGSYEFLKQSTPALFSEEFKKQNPGVVQTLIETYKEFDPASLVSYYEAMINRPDRTAVLVNTSKPVLFIIGKHDNAVPFEDSMKLCHLPSLSYIHILDQSGHMGMLEEPDRCVEIVKTFLNDVTVFTSING